MKQNKKDLALMDDIMGAVTGVDEWQEIQTHDPMITDAGKRWGSAMKQAKAMLPGELYDELCGAHAGEVAATGDAGILFGIRVADVIREVASRPADLSRYVMERMKGMSA